jgi:hypothetical protein
LYSRFSKKSKYFKVNGYQVYHCWRRKGIAKIEKRKIKMYPMVLGFGGIITTI